MSEEDVVAEHHGNGIIPDELFTDDESLCQSVRAWLHFVGKLYTELMAVSEQCLKTRCVLRCGDDQDVADACIHKNRQRIIDHRLVIDREKLFRCYHS